MRRLVAFALVAGAAWFGWRYWRASGLGGALGADADLDRLTDWRPSDLQREFADLDALDTIDRVGFGQLQGDPLADIPLPALRAAIADLAAAGRVAVTTGGLHTTRATQPADRPVIAEAEARRAAAVGLIPSFVIPDAINALTIGQTYGYAPGGGRAVVRIDIGPYGLPGFAGDAPVDRPRTTTATGAPGAAQPIAPGPTSSAITADIIRMFNRSVTNTPGGQEHTL